MPGHRTWRRAARRRSVHLAEAPQAVRDRDPPVERSALVFRACRPLVPSRICAWLALFGVETYSPQPRWLTPSRLLFRWGGLGRRAEPADPRIEARAERAERGAREAGQRREVDVRKPKASRRDRLSRGREESFAKGLVREQLAERLFHRLLAHPVSPTDRLSKRRAEPAHST